MSNNLEIDLLKSQIDNRLKITDETFQNIESEMAHFESYPKRIKEYDKYIKKEYNCLNRIEKLKEAISLLNKQNDIVLQNIHKSKNKIDDLKKHIEYLQDELDKQKNFAEDLVATSDFLGLHIRNKENSVYNVQLSKLPIKGYDLKFSFDILSDKNTIKILQCEPENCIDVPSMMNQLNQYNEKFLNLILLIRQELIRKYS